ncbi:MAG: FtsX-like permease family protein [Candidatus Berkelbacteria bacterium]
MDKIFILKFAFRNLKLHRLRAILTLMGVVIGISAIVFLVAFAFGIERLVTNEVTSGDAFKLVDVGTGNSQIIKLTDTTASNIKGIGGVGNVYGLVTVGAKSEIGERNVDVSFYGADKAYLDKSGIKIAKGASLVGKDNEMIINTAFVKFLNISESEVMGKEISFDIVIPKELVDKSENVQISDQKYKVVGVTNDESSMKVYTNLNNLRAMGVTSFGQFKVEVLAKDKVPEIRRQIENMGLKTQYVGDTVAQINQVFGIFRAILAAFGLITLIVAVLGMFNTLTISLLERIKEIALMKMLGMRSHDINSIFLTESVLLGVTGGVLGLILGVLSGNAVNMVLNHYATSMGGEAVSIFYYPTYFIIAIVIISVLIGILTGIYPARRAVRVKSLDVLRYE